MTAKKVPHPCVSCGEPVELEHMARCATCEDAARRRVEGLDAAGRKLRRCPNGHTLIGSNVVKTDEGTGYCRKCAEGEPA